MEVRLGPEGCTEETSLDSADTRSDLVNDLFSLLPPRPPRPLLWTLRAAQRAHHLQ